MEEFLKSLKERFPRRVDRAEFLGVRSQDLPAKIIVLNNKFEWLKEFAAKLDYDVVLTPKTKSDD